MVPSHANAKKTLMINAASTTNAGTAAGYVDTKGYDFCQISVLMTTSDNVTNKPSVFRILETDATQPTAATNYATISGFVSGTDYTIPNAITGATQITMPYGTFNVDCRGRKRYLRLEVSPVTTQTVSAVATLSRAEQTPAPTSATATVVING